MVKTNGLATAALVCGLGGLVIGVSAPVGVGLGIAALVQIKRRGESGKGTGDRRDRHRRADHRSSASGCSRSVLAVGLRTTADSAPPSPGESTSSTRWRSGSASTTAGATTWCTAGAAPRRTTARSSPTSLCRPVRTRVTARSTDPVEGSLRHRVRQVRRQHRGQVRAPIRLLVPGRGLLVERRSPGRLRRLRARATSPHRDGQRQQTLRPPWRTSGSGRSGT